MDAPFSVLILGSSRIQLLKLVVLSIQRVAPPLHSSVWIWLDMPAWMQPTTAPARSRYVLHKYVRNMENSSKRLKFHSIAFGRHVGTRGLWLAALSIAKPQLILEDDVVLLPGAYRWYRYAMYRMSLDDHILGASFSSQTTVARVGATRRSNTLNETGPYTYPLVGSHGFILNPRNQPLFIEFLEQRSGCMLLIDGLQTSVWYQHFLNKNLVHERMWTQEMVAFAYWYNKTTLYPPTSHPFAVHCATDHGTDKAHKQCLDTTENATRRERLNVARTTAPRHLSWDGVPYRVWSPLKKPNPASKSMRCQPPPPPSPPLTWIAKRMCTWMHMRCPRPTTQTVAVRS
jgi:GR25 family glycosyltransferase involved in LPS biosynthesis